MSDIESTPENDDLADAAVSSDEDVAGAASEEVAHETADTSPAKSPSRTASRRSLFSPGRIIIIAVLVVLAGLLVQSLLTKSKWNAAHQWLKQQVDPDVERARFVERRDVHKYMQETYGLTPVDDKNIYSVEYYHFQTPVREYTLKVRYAGENLQFSQKQYRDFWMEYPVTEVEESVEAPEGGPSSEGGGPMGM